MPSVTQLIRGPKRQAEAGPEDFSGAWRGYSNNIFFFSILFISLLLIAFGGFQGPPISPHREAVAASPDLRQAGAPSQLLIMAPLCLFFKTLSVGGH